jgi:cobalt-zinc-cadmium efflux system membrane fusion protein
VKKIIDRDTQSRGETHAATRKARSLAVALLLASALTACAGATPPPELETATHAPADTATLAPRAVAIGGFQTTTTQLAPWRDAFRAPGRLILDPSTTQTLGSIVEGRVTRVLAHPGDRVRAGQVLVTLHSHEMLDATAALASARAGIARAESALRLATDAAARADRLYAAKALSLAELERAHAGQAEAEALRDQAAAEPTRAAELPAHLVGDGPIPDGVGAHEVLVRSPIAGVVVARDAEPGTVALIGAPLMTVSRLQTLALSLHLPEEAVAAARIGAPVRFTAPAYPGRTFEATVQRVAAAVDTRTRTLEVVAAVANTENLLRPEMFVDAEVLGEAAGEALVVPAEAVHLIEDQTVIIAAEPRGDGGLFIEALPIRVGRRANAAVEILAGLEPGRAIIVQGAATARAELLRRREVE